MRCTMAEKMGILGRKLGMTRIFDGAGAAVPVTVIEAGPCPVTQVKTADTDGYNAVQIALTPAKEKHSTKAMQGHFAKAGKGLFRHLREIRLAGAPEQELGQELTVEIFAAGDTVKVTGTSMPGFPRSRSNVPAARYGLSFPPLAPVLLSAARVWKSKSFATIFVRSSAASSLLK